MTELRLQPGADFALLAAGLYFLGGMSALCALLAAAAVHELGHLTAMELVGAKPQRLRLGMGGGVLDYVMAPSAVGEALILAAGPLAGLLFGLVCLRFPEPFFHYTGLAALLATGFNLLPALPLDGGRLAELLLMKFLTEKQAGRVMLLVGSLSALFLFLLGLQLRMIVISAAGIWLGLLVNFPSMR